MSKNYDVIKNAVDPSIVLRNGELENDINLLKSRLNSEGMLNSGKYVEQLNDLLILYIRDVCSIIKSVWFSLVNAKIVGTEVSEISNIFNILTLASVILAENRLKSSIPIENLYNILSHLGFADKAKEIIVVNINELKCNLFVLIEEEQKKEKIFQLAKDSKTISISSLVISTVISLAALIVSLMK